MSKGELFEKRQLSQPGPSSNNSRISPSGNKHQADVENPVFVNVDKVNNATSNNKKRSYEELYGDAVPSCSKKRSYEELFGDISDFLEKDISGID